LYFHDVGFPYRVPFDKIKLSLPGRIVNEINMRSAAVAGLLRSRQWPVTV